MRRILKNVIIFHALVLLLFVCLLKETKVLASPTGIVTAITFNKQISVTKTTADEVYWYKISIKAGEGVDFNIVPTLNTGYLNMGLYDDLDNRIDDCSYMYNGDYDTLHFVSKLNATYYIKVSGSGLGTFKLAAYKSWFNYNNIDSE